MRRSNLSGTVKTMRRVTLGITAAIALQMASLGFAAPALAAGPGSSATGAGSGYTGSKHDSAVVTQLPAGAQVHYRRFSKALTSNALSWGDEVEMLRARGALLSNYFLLDAALSDYRHAVELAPHYSLAHLDVATALTKLGRFDEAYSSYKQGFKANPANLVLFKTRGMTHFNDEKYGKARRDFKRHLTHNGDDVYRMLWLYLASEKAGKGGKSDLIKYGEKIERAKWPGPLVDLYLGRSDVDTVLAAVDSDQSAGAQGRRCEAYFFIGQWHSVRGETAKAREYFEKTVDTEVHGYMEYASARLELAKRY